VKPIIIYSMARTRSTAALQATRRSLQLNEPILPEGNRYHDWKTLVHHMNDSDTATKFFGLHLQYSSEAREWFTEVVDSSTHEIFVLIRNPHEVIWSLILATQFGFAKHEERPLREVEIPFEKIEWIKDTVGYFLKYLPKNSKVVTFETLPEEFFDYSKVKHVDQHSIQTKKQYVKNLEFVEQEIQYMLNVYENEWKLKLGDSIFK